MEDIETKASVEAVRFAGRVKDFRLAKGWTQAQLAERMSAEGFSMHQTTVAKLEVKARPTTIEEAAALAIVLGVELTMLIGPPDDRAEQRWKVAELERRLAEIKRDRSILQLQLMALDGEEQEALDTLKQVNAGG